MEKHANSPETGAYTAQETVFTMVVWYSHKKDGTPYSYAEKQAKKNRKFHPSYDFVVSEKGKTITTHNEAWEKALSYLTRKRNTIITAFIETNIDGKDYQVAKVTQHVFHVYAKPVYGIGKNLNDVIIRKWDGNPVLKKFQRQAA